MNSVAINIACLAFGLFFGTLLGSSSAELTLRKLMQEQQCPMTIKETQTMVPFCTIEEVDKQAQRYCGDIIGKLMPNISKKGE